MTRITKKSLLFFLICCSTFSPLFSSTVHQHKTIEEAIQAQCWHCMSRHLEELAFLMKQLPQGQNGCSNEAMGCENSTAFHLAAMNGNLKLLTALINNDSRWDPKKHSKDANGNTPMHLAARYGHRECLDLLLKNDYTFDPVKNTKNNFGSTPLKLALMYGHEECALLLIEMRAAE